MKRQLKMRRMAALVILGAVMSLSGVSGLLLCHQALAQDEIRPIVEAKSDHPGEEVTETNNAPDSASEARTRARMLHEAFHGSLQIMHRDYFREDEKLTLPAKSLEDVFEEMARTQKVELRWIAVDTKAMSVAHRPKTDFEHAAVKALANGKKEFETIESDSYRFAGKIRLSAHCLKCHAPSRTSNDDRAAGLIITMPLRKN